MTSTWEPGKAMVEGRHGMVAAQHQVAAQAGADVLAQGGNAMDAAVTTALVLSVVEPWLSGIGGGGFLLWRDGRDGSARSLDFSMMSPRGLRPEDYPLVPGRDDDWFNWPQVQGQRNLIGVHSVCVPGAVAGLSKALAAHGTVTWAEALAPAIAQADKGLEVDWFTALCLSIDAGNLLTDAASTRIFLPDGRAPSLAEGGGLRRLPLTEKAATLRRLATAGARDFYDGQIARDLIADMRDLGGCMDAEDLARYRPRWGTPLRHDWAGGTVLAMPGLSGGPALLDVLAQLDDRPAAGPEARDYAAFADAIRGAYARRLTERGHAETAVDPGCTTHLSVIDAQGHAVSLTNTLLSRFGSKVTSARTGVLLNNGMMWFDPRPGTPNALAPGVQPLANMCPVLAEMPGGGVLAMGAAGGRQIMPAIAQLLAFRLRHGMDLGQALSHPRLNASDPRIRIDRRAPEQSAGLIARHHDVEVVDDILYPVQFAIPSAVERHPDGLLQGMVHPNHPWSAAVAAHPRGAS
ncbi:MULTISPECIES: gamma-glutamyltransferase [Paracoccus]|uniref:gamma-glutamyltransferase family protein n=1 Tax=Paracoccus TaxID=265 RepID=UPI00086DAE8B|nr:MULTISPECIES: gamma-glutamyltransferase [Paracoccus]ODT58513.1 MAG: gamma-glutamyltransferase [Paracoccus sp. SCN 68-21]